ncbi:hypothetical protein BN946_scf184693.g10 [Trametes cinnabarina]|uniref:Uncharacterized protein n=1 Tax=Pycnoporus cinnabarinus TaxID=5643 RepID=A0A060SMN7_PYCCI|nr:hypothetical protein BN946_scf184693.g10 [Trametes cinnabarina]
MDAEHIRAIAQQTGCTHIHPGYGFLSESPQLASLFPEGGAIVFIGPSTGTLRVASDKMQSRALAVHNGVPVAPGAHVSSAEDVHKFVEGLGSAPFPIIIKALDGGGGRGIRLVYAEDHIDHAFRRCVGESASRRVFAEKAFVGPGWRHVEVQIVGDGLGNVSHLWERECSVQRRFQKVVEMAPSTLPRDTVGHVIEAALKMARHLQYKSLGTFEFLIDDHAKHWIFLEINPRIQVEHTVTEELLNIDLVKAQLQLSLPKASLEVVLPAWTMSPQPSPPPGYAIQLRLVAEDPHKDFRLSTGTIGPADVFWPSGRGVRVDTWLSTGPYYRGGLQWAVGVDFDSLLAKIVVHAGTFQEASARALRALRETRIAGDVKTNVEILSGVIAHQDWSSGRIYTQWLEEKVDQLVQLGNTQLTRQSRGSLSDTAAPRRLSGGTESATATALLQPGASFQLSLSPSLPQAASGQQTQKHTLVISSIGRNAFPNELSGTITTSLSAMPLSFSLSQLSSIMASAHTEFANPADPSHVASPIAGKIVELHPALETVAGDANKGSYVRKGEPLVVISVMKMESVVNAPASGRVVRVGRGIEVGNIVAEGALLCVLDVTDMDKGLARL